MQLSLHQCNPELDKYILDYSLNTSNKLYIYIYIYIRKLNGMKLRV